MKAAPLSNQKSRRDGGPLPAKATTDPVGCPRTRYSALDLTGSRTLTEVPFGFESMSTRPL